MTATKTIDLLALAERCEKATANKQRDLLWDAYQAAFGGPECNPVESWPGFKSPRWDAFAAKMHADAYLDAAMTLVPEGYYWTGGTHPRFGAGMVVTKDEDDQMNATKAATPALALCAASLRAMEASK